MKKNARRRVSVPSTALLGRGWEVEASLPWGWNSVGAGDGYGGRTPAKPDTVHVTAWDKWTNGTLIGRTTVRAMVRVCVDDSTTRDGKFPDARTTRDMERLRITLLEAAQYISDAMPNAPLQVLERSDNNLQAEVRQ